MVFPVFHGLNVAADARELCFHLEGERQMF
jgi:hypothetical protein